MCRLVDVPDISDKLGLMRELQIADSVCVEIDAGNNCLNERKLAPEPGKDKARIDLIELFDRNKSVEKANVIQFETGEELAGDQFASRVPLFIGHRFLFCEI